jgi:Cdc6-like AAA superfamily ATPase
MKGEVEVRYSELINFNPIESVIELKKADDLNKAKELVKTYVMSDEMADKLDYGLISQVQLEEVVDNKGVLIVGNYGTGKSHLMSVISAVANNQDLLQDLNNKKFQEYMEPIAGKFEVLRIELGAVDNNLRDIIMKEIEEDLADRGIDYKFPDSSTLTNNKVALAEMMSIFETKYSNSGYLIVVDELLDYLKMRKEQEIMIDLMFLKEAGEFIKTSRFRLICGVQEQLFDNPTFSFCSRYYE